MHSADTQQLYFDEAGFTGNNLLDSDQRLFVYAGVAMNASLATKIHATATSEYSVATGELKGANLVKHDRGRRAISWILTQAAEYTHFMVANKEYALAGKFFEHIYEPVLADHNSLYYGTEFHKFIATVLYICLRARDPVAVDVLTAFSEMMRAMDPDQIDKILIHLDDSDLNADSPLWHILAFACCHQERIKNDLRTVSKSGSVATWPLELSMTALHWLLASWGEKYEALDVYCDRSKPIESARQFFQIFIGRKDKAYSRLGSQPTPSIIYNLSGPLNMVNSKASHGVQIADVMASSLLYALKNPEKEFCQDWLRFLEPSPINEVIPDATLADISNEGGFVNTLILRELVDRSVRKANLSENMADFILNSRALYPQYVLEAASAESHLT